MFTAYSAYFDASGHPDQQEVLTVAGFVSTVKKWARFEREWNSILHSEGIRIFRMADFCSSHGEFAGWKRQPDRRRVFIARLLECTRKNVNKAFAVTLVVSDFDTFNKTFMVEGLLGRPYTLCGMLCVRMLRKWAQRKGVEDHLLYFFEDGDKDKGNFERLHKLAYKQKPKFLSKTEAVGCQPADFAAWKTRSAIQASIGDDRTPENGIGVFRSLELLNRVPHTSVVINSDALKAWSRKLPFPRRHIEV